MEDPVPTARLAGADDAAAVSVLLATNLGDGLYREAAVMSDLGFGGSRVTVGEIDGAIVGAAISRLLGHQDSAYYARFGNDLKPLFDGEPVGSFEALAVQACARHHGAGRALLEDAVNWCRRRGCAVMVTVSWISGRRDSSAGLFSAAGFSAGRTVPDFYLEESVRDGWACPVCGGPCHCAARFFHRRL